MSAREPAAAEAEPGWSTHMALIVVQIAFASQAVESKLLMMAREAGGEAVPPAAVAMVRMLAAAVFFQLFARATGRLAKTARRDHLALAGLAVLGVALNQALFLAGLKQTTPIAAALLSITIPVLTAGLAVALRQERLNARTVTGLLLASGGVLWLTGVRSVDRGAVIIALNSLCYSAYLVLSRGIVRRLGAVTVVAWIFAWAALAFAPLGVPALASSVASFSPRAWGLLAYVVVGPTIVAYLLNAWALGRSSASLVTAYIFLQPVLTALLAWVQLGHTLNARLLVAAAFIACGVGVVATRPGSRSALGARGGVSSEGRGRGG